MNHVAGFLRKATAVVRKGPATLRNILFSRLGIWPVSAIDGCDLQEIPTYCVSLKRATAKRSLMKRQAEGLGLKHFEFVDAVDARAIDREALARAGRIDPESSLRFHGRTLTPAEIGCSLSHGLAYERIVARGHRVALVLEDDALMLSRRLRRIRLDDIPGDFDCAFLNSFLLHRPPEEHIRGMVYRDTSYGGSTAAYLVSAAGANKLARTYVPVVHGSDGLLGRCLPLKQGEEHPFRQMGAPTTLIAYVLYPDAVINGSVSYYHVSEVAST